MGVLLYDADKIVDSLKVPNDQLVAKHREIILDPFDPAVIAAAKEAGISDDWLRSAQTSPLYRFVKEWGLALPLHPEFRTMAMMYYVPPLSPVVSVLENGLVNLGGGSANGEPVNDMTYFHGIEDARVPLQYLANMLSAGNVTPIRAIMKRLLVVRAYMRGKTVKGTIAPEVTAAMQEAGLTAKMIEEIYYLTTMPTVDERFVLPPYHREFQIEQVIDPLVHKASVGFGPTQPPKRGA
jgi:nitrate reductase beta subunit